MSVTGINTALRVVIVGHVDHGKSTLIGRLLYDTNSLPDGKYEEIKEVSEKRGMPIEWSFVLDSFQAERDQAITIDTTQIWFKTEKRDYVIIDAPGHQEFLKNMISGASMAEAAILVVDAKEGVREQTKRHAYLLYMLGLKQVTVVINKMDQVDFSIERFNEVSKEVREYLGDIGITPLSIIPISARDGDNIARLSEHMSWYNGNALLGDLDGFETVSPMVERPLRFPIQDVYKFGEKRTLVGRVETGILRTGDEILFSPSNRRATVTSIEEWNSSSSPVEAKAGQSVGITLNQPIFVERGDIGSHEENPPILTNVFKANIFWLGDKPLEEGSQYILKLSTREAKVTVQSIDCVLDTETLQNMEKDQVLRNDMAEVTLRSREMLALDPYNDIPQLGRCVLLENYDVVGGGIVNMEGYADQRNVMPKAADNLFEVDHLLSADERELRNGHKGAVIWLTGLSGSGKSTLAMRVERRLFNKGYQTYVMDGDNVRRGLNADLSFSPEDRGENIRRIGEVAALMADAGIIVISAFISPYRTDRTRAREAAKGRFHEVYLQTDVETCEDRDPKGLYKKARKGEILEFTGISSPYEAPDSPDLIVNTKDDDVETCVSQMVEYVQGNIGLNETSKPSIREVK